MIARLSLLLLAGLLLAACAGPVAPAPTTPPPPTTEPTAALPAPLPEPILPIATAAAEPTALPAAEPTAALPAPLPEPILPITETASLLPRALYLIADGQIMRLEADGTTLTPITSETPDPPESVPVLEMVVSPADGDLFYLVQQGLGSRLVRAGPLGERPQTLWEVRDSGLIDLRIAPDGQTLAVRWSAPFDQPAAQPNGVYLLPAAGGEPALLLADDPLPDPSAADVGMFGHSPQAWSPDGGRLLLNRYALQVEQCDLAVKAIDAGPVVPLQVPLPPEGERTITCGGGIWSADGAAVYVVVTRVGAPAGDPVIWRADPASGVITPLVDSWQAAPLRLYMAPQLAADGALLTFTAEVAALPPSFSEPQAQPIYAMGRVDPASGALSILRAPEPNLYVTSLWDPAGAGAVVRVMSDDGHNTLLWLPVGDRPPTVLSDQLDSASLQWAVK